MPGRRIQIDYDGEILDMDWDRPDPPTQRDVMDWIHKRRDIKPNAPPAGPPSTTPDLDLPADVPRSLQLPGYGPAKPPEKADTGFMGALGEAASGLGHFAKNLAVGSPFNPDIASRTRAQIEGGEGFIQPFKRGYSEAKDLIGQGKYGEAFGRGLAVIPEAGLGVPVTDITRDLQEGRYGHAAGSAAAAGALAYAGSRLGPRGKPAMSQALPDVPPPARTPTQLPLEYGFDQPGLGFREPPPPSTTIHGPEIGPYGVPDPRIQPPLGELQPVIGQQKLGMTNQPTMPWDIGPEAGTFPGGKPQPLGMVGPAGETIPTSKPAPPAKPRMGPPVGTFEKGGPPKSPRGATMAGEDTGPVGKAATSGIPELQQAAQQTTMYQRVREKIWKLPGARVAADIGKGDISVIRDSGPAGKPLSQLLARTRLLGDQMGGQWTAKAREATAGLTPEQVKVYVESRDKGIVPNDPAVQQALEKRAALDAEVVAATKASGAGYRTAEGTVIPFRERTNYWPHIYERKNISANRQTYIDGLIKEGWSPEDATKAVDNASRYGERFISAQHERQGNAPGYRTDLDADYLHLNDLGKRVAEAREYGPRDLADNQSPLSQLIKQTAEPQRVTEAVSKWLGRDVPESGAAAWGQANAVTRKVVSAAHLSHFALSNMSQLATTPLRANLGAYTKALKQVMKKGGKAGAEAEATGALQTIHQDLLREVGGESWVSKIYGMKKSESLNRTVSALAGKNTAIELFNQLKKDPTNKQARARLENLVLEPIDKVLKQTELSTEQQGIAGGRMSEITQGRAQSIDLPKLWSAHPALEIPLIFKKYAFLQTKIIKDAIMENPKRNIPLMIALYGTMGEVIGDVKAGVKGTVSGQGGMEAIAARGSEGITGQQEIDRIAANLGQAWALGIMTDLISSGGKASGLAEFLGGPVISDVGKAMYGGYKAATDKPGGTGRFDPLMKQGLGAVPFVGSGIAARVGGGGGNVGLPRPPRMTGLPKVPRP